MWGGTHAPIDGAMETGFGGISNFNYNSKHFGLFGHYDYFNDTYRISTSASSATATTRRR